MNVPPKPGKPLSVKVDEQLYDDMFTLLRTGMTVTDAVRLAVAILAEAYRGAWESGRVPQGLRPQVTHVMVARYDGLRLVRTTAEGPVVPEGRGTQE